MQSNQSFSHSLILVIQSLNYSIIPASNHSSNMKQEKTPNTAVISRSPFPASNKIFVPGKIHNIQVAMREIRLTDTKIHNGFGLTEPNPPVTVYDTSGPYTDPNAVIDVKKGLPRIREQWIKGRM